MFRRIIGIYAACWCLSTIAAEPAPLSGTTPAPAQPEAIPKRIRILVLTQSMGYTHSVVTRPPGSPGTLSIAESALSDIGTKNGLYETECIQDATLITPEKLKDLDALIFYTSGDLPIKPAAFTEIQKWLRGGKAFIGIHSATDTFKEFRPYYEMLGATYLRHPWTHGAAVTNLDPTHAATKMFPTEFQWNDELCEQHYFDPRKVRVLLALNMDKSSPKLAKMVPLCWVRDYGKGRVFYTNFGNSESAWSDAQFRAHLLGGVRWALKIDEGGIDPNPEVSAKEDTKARLAVLETQRNWLAKAAKSASANPAVVLAAAEKSANDDKAGFVKLHDAILAARADEAKREAALKPKQRPSDADVQAVFTRRKEIVEALLPKKEQ